MAEPVIEPVNVRVERMANVLLTLLEGRPALEGVGGMVLALSHILNDPTAPPMPPIMDDLRVLCRKFVNELTAFSESDRRFFAKRFAELQGGRIKSH